MHRKESTIVFYQDYMKDIFTTLDTIEIDLFYKLLKVAKAQFAGTYTKEFSIDLDRLPKNSDKTLRKLRTTIMVVNYHKGVGIIEREDINLLRRTRFTQDKLYFSLEKEILKPYMNHRQEFDHVFVKIEYAMKSKYSKFLYRILKEHSGTEYDLHYELLLMLLNLSDPKYLAGRAYNVFNRDVLKKCVDEINEYTDIKVGYYPVKNKLDKKVVDKIIFEIEHQEPIEHPNELSEQEEMDILVSKRIEDKANKQFEITSKWQRIMDKSAYINTIINKIDREDIAAEIRLEKWLKYAKDEFKPSTNQPALLCIDPHHKKEFITITNEFGLYDVLNQKVYTKKPSTTIKRLNSWLEKGADIEFKPLGMIYDEYIISYVNLLPS